MNRDTLLPTHHCSGQVGQGKHGLFCYLSQHFKENRMVVMQDGPGRKAGGRWATRMEDDGRMIRAPDGSEGWCKLHANDEDEKQHRN